MKYQVRQFLKMSEPESYEHGVLYGDDRCWNIVVDLHFEASTLNELLKNLYAFFPGSHIELDACNEPGRIDVLRRENNEGCDPWPIEIDHWQSGKMDLWCATYTGNVERVEDAGSLTEIQQQEESTDGPNQRS